MKRFPRTWLLLLIAGVILLWLGRDQIDDFLASDSMQPNTRSTDSRAVATQVARENGVSSATAKGDDAVVGVSSASGGTPVTPFSAASSPSRTTTPGAGSTTTTYTVQRGDTLYSIAKRYGATVDELVRLNALGDPNNLIAGTELKVPAAPKPAAAATIPAGAVTYTVQRGDTLSSIARQYNVSASELQQANQLANPNALAVGAVLVIPGQPQPTAAPPSATAPANGTPASATPNSGTPNGGTPNGGTSSGTPAAQATPAADTAPTAAPTNPPTPTPVPVSTTAFVPTPAMPTVELLAGPGCGSGGTQRALVWGLSFCQPGEWDLVEQGAPERGIYLLNEETGGERSAYAIVRTSGVPNPPLSLALNLAKGSVQNRLAGYVPGGITPPEGWSEAQTVNVAGVTGRMAQAVTSYSQTGAPARVRVLVFNVDGQPWEVLMIAPDAAWPAHDQSVFPLVTESIRV